MGVLDSILGLGTSSGTQAAAQQGTAALMGGVQDANHALRSYSGQANTALTTNTQAGLGALDSGYDKAIGAFTGYGNQAQGQLAAGVKDATSTVLGGNAAYQPYIASGQGANALYGDALGLGGSAGHDAATSAFQASPGYQFQQQQGADATSRQMAALGMAGSGSTLSAILDRSSNLANQEYGSWLGNLQGLSTQGLNAANSVSANKQTAGGYQMTGGTQGAQLAQNTGQSIGQADANRGTGEAGLYSNLGQGLSSNLTGLGQGLSGNFMNEAGEVAGLGMQAGQAADNVTNANNGILSKLIGSVAGIPLGGSSLSTPSAGGFSMTPGANGSFSFSPTAAASSSAGSGIFGPMLNNLGTGLAKAVAI